MTRRLSGGRLVLATHNSGKVEELTRLLQPYPVELLSAQALGLEVPAETESTFAGNARLKARAAAVVTGLPALSDDSGLEVDVLDGRPGVWTADWAETSEGRNFDVAMRRVRDEMLKAAAVEPWRARFRCTLALAWPDGTDDLFEGSVDGVLVWPPRGANGHGFDPMFVPSGSSVTFGEMDRWEKNAQSHRAMAICRFIEVCFP
jgi:XTP/dITP diphosphohydrolase